MASKRRLNGDDPPWYEISELALAIQEAFDTPPARRPNSHVHGPKTVVLPGKGTSSFEFEGGAEGALGIHLLFTPEYIRWKPQPFRLRLFDGERIRRYFPDLLILQVSGPPLVVEVKPEQHFAQAHVMRLKRVMTAACRSVGAEFQCRNAEELQRQPCLNNLQLLMKFPHDTNGTLPTLIRILRDARRPMPLSAIQAVEPAIDEGCISVGLRLGLIGTRHSFPFGPYFNLYAR